MTEVPRLTLNDGTSIPAIGFGTYPHAGDDSRLTETSI
jgi:diketogulonate reductase-like aldo/keto reductase